MDFDGSTAQSTLQILPFSQDFGWISGRWASPAGGGGGLALAGGGGALERSVLGVGVSSAGLAVGHRVSMTLTLTLLL